MSTSEVRIEGYPPETRGNLGDYFLPAHFWVLTLSSQTDTFIH